MNKDEWIGDASVRERVMTGVFLKQPIRLATLRRQKEAVDSGWLNEYRATSSTATLIIGIAGKSSMNVERD